MYSTKFKPLCLSKRDNISRFIYIHQDRFIYIKFHTSVLRLIYIHQDVNLSKTRFKYTYQHLHTRIKIRISNIYQVPLTYSKIWSYKITHAHRDSHTFTSRSTYTSAYLTSFTLLSICRVFLDTGKRSLHLFSIYYSLSFSIT